MPNITEACDLEVVHADQIVGNQSFDPENAATVFIPTAENDSRPLHLFLGTRVQKLKPSKNDPNTYESFSSQPTSKNNQNFKIGVPSNVTPRQHVLFEPQ